MDSSPLHDLRNRMPAIKEQWLQLLHTEPVLSPLGRPDTLVYLMDTTLAQLAAAMEREPDAEWLRHCEPVAGSVHRYCSCGLNPLLKYFSTGELALRAGAGTALGGRFELVLARFRLLAQHEIQALCAVCVQPAGGGCNPARH